MTNEIRVDGACYCGKVTIDGSVSADKVMACHCTDCQIFSGAPFRAVAVMSVDNVTIAGPVQEYRKVADSGNERVQGFCGNCGSQIFAADPEIGPGQRAGAAIFWQAGQKCHYARRCYYAK